MDSPHCLHFTNDDDDDDDGEMSVLVDASSAPWPFDDEDEDDDNGSNGDGDGDGDASATAPAACGGRKTAAAAAAADMTEAVVGTCRKAGVPFGMPVVSCSVASAAYASSSFHLLVCESMTSTRKIGVGNDNT